MKFRTFKKTSFERVINQILTSIGTSIVSHQILYLLQPKQKNISLKNIEQQILLNLKFTRRPT